MVRPLSISITGLQLYYYKESRFEKKVTINKFGELFFQLFMRRSSIYAYAECYLTTAMYHSPVFLNIGGFNLLLYMYLLLKIESLRSSFFPLN